MQYVGQERELNAGANEIKRAKRLFKFYNLQAPLPFTAFYQRCA